MFVFFDGAESGMRLFAVARHRHRYWVPVVDSSAGSLIFCLDSRQPGCRRALKQTCIEGPWVGSVSGLETLALNRTKERRADQRSWQVERVWAELSLGRWDAIDFQEEVGRSIPSVLFTPPFIFIAFLLPPSLPPSLLVCFCPLLSATPDKQPSTFALRRRARRHLLPPRTAGGSALIPLALGASSSLLHAPPHLKSIAARTSIPHTALFSPHFQLHLLLLLLLPLSP